MKDVKRVKSKKKTEAKLWAKLTIQVDKIYAKFKAHFAEDTTQALPLLPLLPQSGKSENVYYSDQLENALKNKKILNIALTGSYGSGKSSIILGLKDIDKERVLQISFSSLGANIQGLIQDGQSEEHSKLVDIANLIQKEVLKQILFRERKHKLPNSQFLRIAKPIKRYQFVASLIISTIVLTTLLVFGIVQKLLLALGISDNFISIVFVSDLYVTMIASVWLFFLLAARSFKIDKIGNSAVSLSLSPADENSYFDKYLVEILYFFESTKYDIVVFEDIDRFENLYIFENLRQLNTILNTTKQIKRRIRFIYAVKDSIFTKSVLNKTNRKPEDDNESEVKSTNIDFNLNDENIYNRTKFFDLIIPVVPFITSSSSSEHLLGFFDKEDKKELKGPVQTASKYISDMRLVKNLHNEYLVFKKMILTPNSGLSKAKLYAMVIYKNINLEDFELIKAGKSKLNEIMRQFNSFVTQESVSISADIVKLQTQLNNLNSLKNRAESLGELLRSDITRYVSQMKGTRQSIVLDGVTWTEDELLDVAFWEGVIESEKPELKITFVSGSGYSEVATYTLADIQRVTGNSLSKKEWEEVDAKEIRSKMQELRSSLKQLRIMTLQSAVSRYPDRLGKSLRLLLVDDEITWDLIQAGYIDNDFTNYTSIYNDSSVSLEARAFILLNINHDSPSPGHKFKDPDDIENMLEQIGEQGLRSKGIFNIEILDYLLKNPLDQRISQVFSSFDPNDSSELSFIDLYLKEGKHPIEFIKYLTRRWSNTLIFLSDNKTLLDSDKAKYIDVAITAITDEVKYPVNEYTIELLGRRPEYFNTLSNIKSADRINSFLTKVFNYGVEFHNLSGLSEVARKTAVEKNLYQVNGDNLELLTGSRTPSLTKLRDEFEHVYNKVASKLEDYAKVFNDQPQNVFTIASNSNIEAILNDIVKSDEDTISKIMDRIDVDSCTIHNIEMVPTSIWDSLLRKNLPDNTASNVISYFKHSAIDANQPEVLNDEIITFINKNLPIVMDKEFSEFDESQMEAFSVAILNSKAFTIPDKISVVNTMYPETYISVKKIKFSDELLAGELVGAGVIGDSIENYTYIKENSPNSIKHWMTKASKFESYLPSISLSSDEIDAIMLGDYMPSSLKSYILSTITQVTPNLSSESKRSLAKFAAETDATLEYSEIEILASSGNWHNIASLIVNSHDRLTNTQIIDLLVKIGGEFPKLVQAANKPAKFAKLPEYTPFLEDLKKRGFVSSISVKQNEIIAYMKKKLPV